MTLKFRTSLCWLMTASVAVQAVGAVMGTSPTTGHRAFVAVSLAFMVVLSGWFWSMLSQHKVKSDRMD